MLCASVFVLALAENAIDAVSYKPHEIVKSLKVGNKMSALHVHGVVWLFCCVWSGCSGCVRVCDGVCVSVCLRVSVSVSL